MEHYYWCGGEMFCLKLILTFEIDTLCMNMWWTNVQVLQIQEKRGQYEED